MRLNPFELERYFATREFSARYLLSSSDCEPLAVAELLGMADPDGLARWEGLKLGYTETRGAPLLLEQIASLYEEIVPEQALVCAPVEGIFLVMNALLDAGDHIICTVPAYQSLFEVARAVGCEVECWPADEQQGWRFDPAWLEEHLRPDTRMVVTNFPHNPTGCLPVLADWARVVALVRARGAYLFSDEMYRYLELDPAARLPAACDVYERAVSLSGMSKTFGMPGARIGWLASRDAAALERVAALKDYTTICASAPSEVLATIALAARERIVAGNLALVRENLAALNRFFARHRDTFAWHRPSAGSVAFVRLLTGEDSAAYCERALEQAGVLLLPSCVFDWGGEHLRMGFGRREMPEALAAFESFVEGG